jgi:hypothetical protein
MPPAAVVVLAGGHAALGGGEGHIPASPLFADRNDNSALRAALLGTGRAEAASARSTGSVKGESTRHS